MAAVSASVMSVVQHNRRYAILKRALDVTVALMMLAPFGLLMAVVGLCIVMDSPGPVFYRQKRIGMHGEEFFMLKFRSMRTDADDAVHRQAIERFMNDLPLNDAAPDGACFKLAGDARVTRVGKILRKTSLDELPQLLNVLAGNMSLVGPRPPLPYEVERYGHYDWLRLAGKPGITGPWQVYGRSRVTFRQMVEMDVHYLLRQSLLEDFKLILLTVPAMIGGSGAG
jgi:lipopolysaccharide/colanic/teichoic acid biosynthesis glycosyltransferase